MRAQNNAQASINVSFVQKKKVNKKRIYLQTVQSNETKTLLEKRDLLENDQKGA